MTTDESSASCDACSPAEPEVGNYFVSTYPPFSCWSADELDRVARVLDAPSSDLVPLGLYLHVPFCAERCDFCYYRSYAKPTRAQTDNYIDALHEELSSYATARAVADRRLDFAYFGGGTPSLLAPAQIERLLNGVKSRFPFADAREITFECAPQTVTADRLTVLRDAGITRISMGVQQLNDEVLRKNGRIHRVENVERAWAEIERFNFPVVNLDLMVGLVGETDESFFASLSRVIEFAPMSVTIYLLEIPPNTPLYQALREQKIDEPPVAWDVKRERLARAFELLEGHGYSVRSAYAAVRDPRQGRFVYQEAQYHGADLLGTGVASFSYFNGVHYQNHTSLERYLGSVSDGRLPHARACVLGDEERLVREFVLQLKLGRVSARDFQEKFGVAIDQHFAVPLEACAKRGWVRSNDYGVELTRSGLLRVDRLIPAFYLPRHRSANYW